MSYLVLIAILAWGLVYLLMKLTGDRKSSG